MTQVIPWTPNVPLPDEPSVVLTEDLIGLCLSYPPGEFPHMAVQVMSSPRHGAFEGGDKDAASLTCTGTPDPEDVAALLAIPARAHCLVLDGEGPWDLGLWERSLHTPIDPEDGPFDPGPLNEWIAQVFILSGQPEHVADAIGQCGEAGVACWVMEGVVAVVADPEDIPMDLHPALIPGGAA